MSIPQPIQEPDMIQSLLSHPVIGILLFFIGIYIFYKFVKLTLKYTVKNKSN